jgi:hypothetical protein
MHDIEAIKMADALRSINCSLGVALYGLTAQVASDESSVGSSCATMEEITKLLDSYLIEYKCRTTPQTSLQYIQVMYCSHQIEYFYIYPRTLNSEVATVNTKFEDTVVVDWISKGPEEDHTFTREWELLDVLHRYGSLITINAIRQSRVWYYVRRVCDIISSPRKLKLRLSMNPSNLFTSRFTTRTWLYGIEYGNTTIAYFDQVEINRSTGIIGCIIPVKDGSTKMDIIHQGNEPLNLRHIQTLLISVIDNM